MEQPRSQSQQGFITVVVQKHGDRLGISTVRHTVSGDCIVTVVDPACDAARKVPLGAAVLSVDGKSVSTPYDVRRRIKQARAQVTLVLLPSRTVHVSRGEDGTFGLCLGSTPNGVLYVSKLLAPATHCGLLEGDILVAVNGTQSPCEASAASAMLDATADGPVALEIRGWYRQLQPSVSARTKPWMGLEEWQRDLREPLLGAQCAV